MWNLVLQGLENKVCAVCNALISQVTPLSQSY